jgi:hypothetical protein
LLVNFLKISKIKLLNLLKIKQMKTLLKTLLISTLSFSTFAQQATEIDSKSAKLPQYSNASAINAVITTPQTGMMVYNQASSSPNFYNGSSWQSFTSTPSAEFRNSMAFRAGLNTVSGWSNSYTFTVPSGITKIWVEGWGGGDSGGYLSGSVLVNTVKGGDAGSYLSAIVPVTPNEVLTIYVGTGGSGNSILGGTTQIQRGNSPSVSFFEVGSSPFTYYLPTDPATGSNGLLAFVQGEIGHQPVESYSQTSATNFIRTISGGEGGTAYPAQKGGSGVTVTFNLALGTVYSSFGSTASSGASPGGGGGVGNGNGASGSGGPGMVILHW